jgi:hypothetical protein
MQVGDLVKKRNCVGFGIVLEIVDNSALVCAVAEGRSNVQCRVWVDCRRLEVVK